MITATVIHDAALLVVGRRYVIYTDEPEAEFHVGAFRGWLFDTDGDTTGLVTVIPTGDWQSRYPRLIFDHAKVEDHWCLTAEEE